MDFGNLALQLGVSVVVVGAGVKVALAFLRNWREVESERTQMLREMFAAMAGVQKKRATPAMGTPRAKTEGGGHG